MKSGGVGASAGGIVHDPHFKRILLTALCKRENGNARRLGGCRSNCQESDEKEPIRGQRGHGGKRRRDLQRLLRGVVVRNRRGAPRAEGGRLGEGGGGAWPLSEEPLLPFPAGGQAQRRPDWGEVSCT